MELIVAERDDPTAAIERELEQPKAMVAELQQRLGETTDALDAARRALALALETQQATLVQLEQAAAAAAELHRLQATLAEVRASEAYRVGLAVTWPARRAKRLLGRS